MSRASPLARITHRELVARLVALGCVIARSTGHVIYRSPRGAALPVPTTLTHNVTTALRRTLRREGLELEIR